MGILTHKIAAPALEDRNILLTLLLPVVYLDAGGATARAGNQARVELHQAFKNAHILEKLRLRLALNLQKFLEAAHVLGAQIEPKLGY